MSLSQLIANVGSVARTRRIFVYPIGVWSLDLYVYLVSGSNQEQDVAIKQALNRMRPVSHEA